MGDITTDGDPSSMVEIWKGRCKKLITIIPPHILAALDFVGELDDVLKQNDPNTTAQDGRIHCYKDNNETLAKVPVTEPIFVLRAQDKGAPAMIMLWIANNVDTVSEEKLKQAFGTAMEMRRFEQRREPT